MIETVTSDLKTLKAKDKLPARVLVTGATGYVGGRLVRELLAHDYRVRVLVRDAHRLQDYPWKDRVEIVEGDALDPKALSLALKDIDLAYYMLHALMVSKNFEQLEEDLARTFGEIAKSSGVRRIVYLGGITSSDDSLSPHMSARAKTGEILRSSGVPTIELRAGVVIGSGSASFEMKINDAFDIGGPDVFTYMEMMQIYAEVAGLRRRIILPLPVLTPRLASG